MGHERDGLATYGQLLHPGAYLRDLLAQTAQFLHHLVTKFSIPDILPVGTDYAGLGVAQKPLFSSDIVSLFGWLEES